jgi:hypothetical protein
MMHQSQSGVHFIVGFLRGFSIVNRIVQLDLFWAGGQSMVLLTMDGISEHSSRFKRTFLFLHNLYSFTFDEYFAFGYSAEAVDVICRLLQRHARRNRQTAFWLFQAVANVAAST